MFPAFLWIAIWGGAAALVGVRLQLTLLARYPEAGGLAAAAGLAAGAALGAVALATPYAYRSWRGALALFLALPALALAGGYYSITHFPQDGFKDGSTSAEWNRLHPTLRLGLCLLRLGDGGIVITDMVRHPREYEAMGLPRRDRSKHFIQIDGYAHAADLRVTDSGALRNWVRQGLLVAMGLQAERHSGSGDHLHVALP